MDVTAIDDGHPSLLQAGLDHIDQGISVFDRDLRLVGWNRRFIELIDFPPEMVRIGTPFEAFIRYNAARGEYGEGAVDDLVAARVRAARTFVPHYLERTRPNGVILAVQGSPLARGGFVTVYTDITTRRRTEALIREHSDELEARVAQRTAELTAANDELRKSIARVEDTARALEKAKARLRLITDALPASIAYIDRELMVRFANRRFAELATLTSDAVVGRRLEDVLGIKGLHDIGPHLAAAFAGRTATFDLDCAAPGGKTSTTHNVLVPEMGGNDHVLGIFALSLDITEARKAERALRDAQKMAAIGQLAGGLAHDFNNLLTVVVGNLSSLKDRVDIALAEQHVEPAIRAGHRGVAIARRLLAFARRQPLDPSPVDVEQIVGRTARLLRASLPSSIAITCAADEAPWSALADSNQLENALVNLALNARDAMPGGGALAFRVANRAFPEGSVFAGHPVAGHYIQVSVSDTGTGIDAATLARAFEPFFTTKPFGVGTGLGLSMVYGFVKQSGGHIRIATEVGAGTCVSLLLPRADSAADIAACGNDGPHPRNAGELILLVESDDDTRIAIRRDLLELGYTVIEARDGVEAEGLLRTIADVRVLVADAAMPGGVPGQALAALARQQRPDLKIVLIGGGETEGAGLSKGDLACLHKPVEKGDVMRVIERWERTTPSTRG